MGNIKVGLSTLRLTEWRPYATNDPDSVNNQPWNNLTPEQLSSLMISFKKIAVMNVSDKMRSQMQDEAVLQFLPYYVNHGGLIRPASIPTTSLMR